MKKILSCLCVVALLASVTTNVFAGGYQISKTGSFAVGNTVLIEKNKDSVLPLMFTTEVKYSYDKNERFSSNFAGVEKISYTNLFNGNVRPYIRLGGESLKERWKGYNSRTHTAPTYGFGVEAILKKMGSFKSKFVYKRWLFIYKV